MLVISFADSETILHEYRDLLKMCVGLALATLLIGALLVRSQRERFSWFQVVLLPMIAFVILQALARSGTVNNFIKAAIGSDRVELTYAESSRGIVVLRREDISAVTFGIPDKGSRSCYLNFTLHSGKSYSSASVTGLICKEYRSKAMLALDL